MTESHDPSDVEPARPPERGEAAPPGRAARLLVVEDNSVVRDLMRTILAEHGYDAVASGHPREALAIADGAAEPFDLLVTDLSLPELNGRELADRLRQKWPGLKVLFTSGYPNAAMIAGGGLSPGSGFLQKPFAGLMQAVHDVLASG